MIEESANSPQQDSNVIYSGQGRCLEPTGTSSQAPGPRFKHQSFMYKGRLYVHGGTTIPSSDFTDDPLDLHCFHFEGEAAGRWQRIRTKVVSGKELELVSAHAGIVNGNKWYVFGGSNNECRPSNHLLRLNLDTYEWSRLQQKGEVPSPRESAFLASLERNWLLLYGGLSTIQVDIYNTFHFYNIDTRNWSLCQGSHQYQVYSRLDPALCYFRDRLYMFGGTYRTITNEERYLDDFYQIIVNAPARNQAGKVQMKRLSSSRAPEGRSGHCLVGVGQHHLALIGGQNTSSQLRDGLRFQEVSLVHSMWLFDTRSATWNILELALYGFRFRTMSSCINRNDHLYLFGGLHSYSAVLNDLVELSIDSHALVTPPKQPRPCLKCIERARFPPVLRNFPASVVDEVAQSIDFPFAAFGLLIDNSMNSGATLLKISYFQALGTQKAKLLKFEDDAKLNWTDEELLDTVVNFSSGPLSAPAGTDKKIKIVLQRDQARREYGSNLKAASLRLGNGFLFISYNGDDSLFRVFSMEKQDQGSPAERYILYHYSFNIFEKKVCKPEMEAARQYITAKYGDLIDGVFFHRKCKNTLIIFNPRVQDVRGCINSDDQAELKADIQESNILNGPIAKIRQLQKRNFQVQESVDISLRAYITCLYLKNDSMKIMLSVKQSASHPIEVQTQAFLQKVDRQCKQKHVLQINNAFEFDLKITEIYYLYNIQRKSNFFNNGLLIYHKNRLITRFKYPLGELLFRKYYKYNSTHNFLRLFGFIELPDHIPVNLFKTSYLHHIMMEKLLSRLKFIAKSFKKEMLKLAKNPDYRRPAPTKLNEEEAQQEKSELSESKPPKERPSRQDSTQREISLRRRKNPQKETLEQRLKGMLKNPDNIKQIMKLIELNTEKHDDIGHKRTLFPSSTSVNRAKRVSFTPDNATSNSNSQKPQMAEGLKASEQPQQSQEHNPLPEMNIDKEQQDDELIEKNGEQNQREKDNKGSEIKYLEEKMEEQIQKPQQNEKPQPEEQKIEQECLKQSSKKNESKQDQNGQANEDMIFEEPESLEYSEQQNNAEDPQIKNSIQN